MRRLDCACHDQLVVITIRLTATEPPAGCVSLPGEAELPFVGWLGLLRVLADLFGSRGG
jgi:hypothetical protein